MIETVHFENDAKKKLPVKIFDWNNFDNSILTWKLVRICFYRNVFLITLFEMNDYNHQCGFQNISHLRNIRRLQKSPTIQEQHSIVIITYKWGRVLFA